MRLPFITRLKRLFRRKPRDVSYDRAVLDMHTAKRARGEPSRIGFRVDESGNICGIRLCDQESTFKVGSENFEAKQEAASDALLVAWVRDEIAKANEKAVEAALTSASTNRARKLTVILTDSGHVARVIIGAHGKPELDIDCGERWSIATGDHRGETFAELIRIADALHRLSGVKK